MYEFNLGILPQPTMQLSIKKIWMLITITPNQNNFHGVHIGIYFPNMFRYIFLMQASNMFQNYIYIHMIYIIDLGQQFTCTCILQVEVVHDSITYSS